MPKIEEPPRISPSTPAHSGSDVFDRLYIDQRDPDAAIPKSPVSSEIGAPEVHDETHQRLIAQMDALREAYGRLQQSHDRLITERDSLQDELDQLCEAEQTQQTGSEPDHLEQQPMAGEHSSLPQPSNEQDHELLNGLQVERDSLQQEVASLRDAVQTLQAELAERSRASAGDASRHEEELQEARRQIEELEARAHASSGAVENLRSERDELTRLIDEHRRTAEAERHRHAEHVQELERLARESDSKNDGLVEQLRTREGELASRLEAMASLEAEQRAAMAETERLREQLDEQAKRFQAEAGELRTQIDSLQGELGDAHEQIRSLQRFLDEERQAQQYERGRLETSIQEATERHEAGELERQRLQARIQELLEARERLEADHASSLESLRASLSAEFQSTLDTERARYEADRSEVEARAVESATLAERLKAEILTIAENRSTPDADLEAARQEIAALRKKLADTEVTRRSMSSLLEGMGIRLH
jgi:chromosome segregation ATPase